MPEREIWLWRPVAVAAFLSRDCPNCLLSVRPFISRAWNGTAARAILRISALPLKRELVKTCSMYVVVCRTRR